MVVREEQGGKSTMHQGGDENSMQKDHQKRLLPKAAALTSAHSLEKLNETISYSSSKNSLTPSNSLKALSLHGKSYRNQTIESSKMNGQKVASKVKGNSHV